MSNFRPISLLPVVSKLLEKHLSPVISPCQTTLLHGKARRPTGILYRQFYRWSSPVALSSLPSRSVENGGIHHTISCLIKLSQIEPCTETFKYFVILINCVYLFCIMTFTLYLTHHSMHIATHTPYAIQCSHYSSRKYLEGQLTNNYCHPVYKLQCQSDEHSFC